MEKVSAKRRLFRSTGGRERSDLTLFYQADKVPDHDPGSDKIMTSVFETGMKLPRVRRPQTKLRPRTLKDFGGGLDVVNNDINMNPRYATVLKNFYRGLDGTQTLRYGTKWVADYASVAASDVVECGYFNNSLIAATLDGRIVRIDLDTFISTVIWDDTIAGGLPGAPSGWTGDSKIIDMNPFKRSLTIHNGVDKPLEVEDDFSVRYLQDLATGSNINTPVGRFATTVGNYHVIGGVPIGGEGWNEDAFYEVGDIVYDPDDGKSYKCQIPHQASAIQEDFTQYNNQAQAEADGWTFGDGWSFDATGDKCVCSGAQSGDSDLYKTRVLPLDIGAFSIEATIEDYVAGNIAGFVGGSTRVETDDVLLPGNGTFEVIINNPDAANDQVGVSVDLDFQGSISFIQLSAATFETFRTNHPGFWIEVPTKLSTVLYMSSTGTIGTFPGDPSPNDAITLDVGAYAPEESANIRGLSAFRNFLLVHFSTVTLVFTLGTFDSNGNHKPVSRDTLPKFGALSHRVVTPIVNDALFGDGIGVNTLKRNIFAETVESDRISERIAPRYQASAVALTAVEATEKVWSVYDRLAGIYTTFFPDGDGIKGYAFRFNERMRARAFSEFVDWDWDCGTSTELGRVFFFKGTRVYQYGNLPYGEEFLADKLEDRDADWAVSTLYAVDVIIRDTDTSESYKCLVEHTSASSGTFAEDRAIKPDNWEKYEGEAITFDWEMPWNDFDQRMRMKHMKFVGLDTKGENRFELQVFVDNIYQDKLTNEYKPALSIPFVGGESLGYGGGDQPYGGGRRTQDERLWSNPVKFNIVKLRVTGSGREGLSIAAISVLLSQGRFGR